MERRGDDVDEVGRKNKAGGRRRKWIVDTRYDSCAIQSIVGAFVDLGTML